MPFTTKKYRPEKQFKSRTSSSRFSPIHAHQTGLKVGISPIFSDSWNTSNSVNTKRNNTSVQSLKTCQTFEKSFYYCRLSSQICSKNFSLAFHNYRLVDTKIFGWSHWTNLGNIGVFPDHWRNKIHYTDLWAFVSVNSTQYSPLSMGVIGHRINGITVVKDFKCATEYFKILSH